MNSKSKYEADILEVIKKNNLFVIQDIFAFYTGIKCSQFYNLELEKSESIKKALDDNKIKTKHSLKAKWAKSDNPTLQLALFKTICTDEEREHISMNFQKTDLSNKDGSLREVKIIVSESETAKKLKELREQGLNEMH